MANIELDGGNKKITVDSGDLTLDIPGDIILDADGGDLTFADGGTNLLKVTNSSSDVVLQPQVDAKDIIFKQYDGRNLLEINDGGYVAIANGATGPGQLRLYEDTDNGTNYSAFQVGTQSGDITYTLPTADGSNGHALTTNGSGTLSWASAGTTYAGIDDQSSSNDDQLTISDTAVIINEDSDDLDFRVESNSNTHMLFVDAGNNRVQTGAANGGQILNASGANSQAYEQTLTHAIALAMPGIEIQNSNTTDGNGSCISFMDGGGFINGAVGVSHEDHDTNGGGYLFFATRATSSGADTANEAMRVGSNGSVAIGKIAADATKLKVQTTTDSENTLQLRHGDADNPSGVKIDYYGGSPNGSGDDFIHCRDSANPRFVVQSDGDCTNDDNAYGAISDERIKQDITDASSQWDDIKALKVRKYRKKEDVRAKGESAHYEIGLIAQEAELVSPKLIKEVNPGMADITSDASFGTIVDDTDNQKFYLPKDTLPAGKKVGDPVLDESGNPTYYKKVGKVNSKVKSMKYSILYMKAIKALQEAQTRIETLETKVKALEG